MDTLKGIGILWDKGLQILKETTLRKHEILDRFNILSYFSHNYLVRTPIEVIKISMESQEEDIQLLCFTFFKIRAPSRSKLARTRTRISRNVEHSDTDIGYSDTHLRQSDT